MSPTWPRILLMQRRCKIRMLTFSGATLIGGRGEAFASGADANARQEQAGGRQPARPLETLGGGGWTQGPKGAWVAGFHALIRARWRSCLLACARLRRPS